MLVIHHRDVAIVLVHILQANSVRLPDEQHPDALEEWQDIERMLTELEQRIEALSEGLSVSIQENKDYGSAVLSRDDAGEIETRLVDAERHVRHRLEELHEAEREEAGLKAQSACMAGMRGLDIPLNALLHAQYLSFEIGHLSQRMWERLETPAVATPMVVVPIAAKNTSLMVVAAADRDHAHILKRFLTRLSFEPAALPEGVPGTADEQYEMLADRLSRTEKRKQSLEMAKRRLASEWGERLNVLWNRVTSGLQVISAMKHFARSGDYHMATVGVQPDEHQRLLEIIRDLCRHPYAVFSTSKTERAA